MNKKRIHPPKLTVEEVNASVNEIVAKHFKNNQSLFKNESFKISTPKNSYIIESSVARATLINPNRSDTRIVFDSTEDNDVKQNNPKHYQSVSQVFKDILIEISGLYKL